MFILIFVKSAATYDNIFADEEGARDRKSIDHKNTKWTKFKDKVKGSLRIKTASEFLKHLITDNAGYY